MGRITTTFSVSLLPNRRQVRARSEIDRRTRPQPVRAALRRYFRDRLWSEATRKDDVEKQLVIETEATMADHETVLKLASDGGSADRQGHRMGQIVPHSRPLR